LAGRISRVLARGRGIYLEIDSIDIERPTDPVLGGAWMRVPASKLLVFVLAVGGSAAAAPRPTALSWIRETGAESCPDPEQVRRAVASRLGSEPFDDQADTRITAHLSPGERGLVGTLEVTGRDGTPLGRRELSSPTGDCAELSAAMELAIAIAIDPQYLRRRPETAAPAVAIAAPGPHFVGAVGALLAAGLSPSVIAPGAAVHLSLEWPRFSLGIDGRADFAPSVEFAGGRVSTSVLLGSASPCVRLWRVDACAVISVGALQVTSDLGGPQRRQSGPLVLAGGRAQLPIELTESLSLRPFFDVQAVLTRTSFLSGSTAVWVTPPVVGALGLALGVRFF
jgi:hypothetical protein